MKTSILSGEQTLPLPKAAWEYLALRPEQCLSVELKQGCVVLRPSAPPLDLLVGFLSPKRLADQKAEQCSAVVSAESTGEHE